MFTPQELNALSLLLRRVNITGEEALAVAQLQIKIGGLIKQEAPVETKEEVTPAA